MALFGWPDSYRLGDNRTTHRECERPEILQRGVPLIGRREHCRPSGQVDTADPVGGFYHRLLHCSETPQPPGYRFGQNKLASSAAAAPLVDLSLSVNIHVDNTQGDMTSFIKFLGVFDGKQRWAMYAGNVLGNSLISVANPNAALLHEQLTDGYYLEDVNFDGKVTIPINLQSPSDNSDVSIMFKNRSIYSLIRE